MSDGESNKERLDRELMELLQELRVVIPGVQVLLAFLLTAPFQQRFAQLPGSMRNAFFASIACATLVLFGVLWYVVPMVGRSPSSEEEGSGEDETGGEQDQESRGASSRR